MRNKKIITLFVMLVFVTTAILLNSVVFSVRVVQVNCINSDDSFFIDKVRSAVDIGKGSIMLIDKGKVSQDITQTLPECRVIKIERVFPDRLIIHSQKRYPSAYLMYANKYYIISGDSALLTVAGSKPTQIPEIILEEPTTRAEILGLELGKVISVESPESRALVGVLDVLERLTDFEYRNIVRKIKVASETREIILNTYLGVDIVISGFGTLDTKIQIAATLYSQYPAYRHSGCIIAYQDDESGNGVKASYLK